MALLEYKMERQNFQCERKQPNEAKKRLGLHVRNFNHNNSVTSSEK